MDFFQEAISHLLRVEGAYVEQAQDQGGPTNFGIRLITFQSWANNFNLTKEDLAQLSAQEAADLYRRNLWEPLKLSEITRRVVATMIFDQIVHCGSHAAIKRAQEVLKSMGFELSNDGILGPKTLKALNDADLTPFVVRYMAETQKRYVTIVSSRPEQMRYLSGWLHRTYAILLML